MRVNERIKKCVAFIVIQMADKSFRPVGTAFFIGRDQQKNMYSYAVTAKHVLEGIKKIALPSAFLRLNTSDGKLMVVETKISDWIYHEDQNVDIAIFPIGLSPEMDHLLYPESSFLTDEIVKKNEIDVGDEVFIAGLFKHHHGKTKKLSIIRVGNISAMPDEKIQTEDFLMDGYLIEARSIGGLSGSPVFMNLGVARQFEGEVKFLKGYDLHNLLGIVHGHYDSYASKIDILTEDSDKNEKVNTGMAIITPISKLIEMFEQEKLKKHETWVDEEVAKINKVSG